MKEFVSYKILPENRLVLCNFQGRISVEEMLKLVNNVVRDPQFQYVSNILLDFRDSYLIVFKSELSGLVNYLKEVTSFIQTVKLGLLYSTPNQAYLFGIFTNYGEQLNLATNKFKFAGPCLQWMEIDDSEISSVEKILGSIKTDSDSLSE